MNEININIDIRLDFNVRKGETFERVIAVKNEDGSNYDFTGHTVTWEWLRLLTDPTPELIFNTADGLILASGEIQLKKVPAKMAIQAREYYHFLWVTDAAGNKKAWLNGIALHNNGLFNGNPGVSPSIVISPNGTPLTLTIQGAAVTLAKVQEALAGLNAAEGDVLQYKGGVWTNRTLAQLYNDLLPFILNPNP